MANEQKNKELEILKFWKENKIYEKLKRKNSKGKKFYMMDGPPYATGHIHLGTALNKILKDIAMRSKRLQGCDVFDRPGYDTHGVPIEFQVEKEIGSKSKKDIEKYGVEKFVKKCKEYATKHIGYMNGEFENLGVWMDWQNPYLTLDDEYVEVIWNAFKEADKKGLLYLGKYPVHICTRCETAVAYNEIEYKKQKDVSIYVKFPLKNKKDSYLVIWTTTPWTLPGNTGIMVHPEIIYQEIKVEEKENWIIAKDLVDKVMGLCKRKFEVIKEFKGKEMEGWNYENPLSKNLKLKIKNGYKVVLSARYVTIEEGTGLVHCAPGHGKEDYEVGKAYGLDMPSPVYTNGLLSEETGKYAGKKAREVDKEIINDLEDSGNLVFSIEYEHDYPTCWRDGSPLLMVSMPQWFLKISEIQKDLLKENEKTKWVPDWMKLRMKAWLEGIGDWPVSRQRYWGTPLPIWYDEKSGEKIVVGSIEELKKLSGVKEINVHKPEIDQITIKTKSGKILKRVPEVLDVWFDSGVSSWAALPYLKNKEVFKKYWPADLNIEGRDQVRGWWNSQMILSQIVFEKKPFESILVHGMVLDLGKIKMSKSKGNYVSPEEIIEKYGRDFMRYYFAKFSKGEDFSFNEKEMLEIQKFMIVLNNINSFVEQLQDSKNEMKIEDKWIISKYNSLLKKVKKSYDEYKFFEVIYEIENFVLMDLSRKYIQMIRDRADETKKILSEIRIGLIKLLAPIIPFYSEMMWQELRKKKIVNEESIFLSSWPDYEEKKIEEDLEKNFDEMLKIIERGMAARDTAKIGLRWPLASAQVIMPNPLKKELGELLKKQLNVKKIEIKKGENYEVKLDTKLTEELEAEGFAREISRVIQAERKKAGLKKGELIKIKIFLDSELKNKINRFSEFLKERVNASELIFSDEKIENEVIVFTIREKKIGVIFCT